MSFLGIAFENAHLLNIPRKQIGVSWADIAEFCDAFKETGTSEDIINEKLAIAIVEAQNKIYKKKSVCVPKKKKNWQNFLQNKDEFDLFSFNLNNIFHKFYNVKNKKEIMSIVIGKKGHYFKEWTNYWNAGSIMFDNKSNKIIIYLNKNDNDNCNKFSIMHNFILSEINKNVEKFYRIRNNTRNF